MRCGGWRCMCGCRCAVDDDLLWWSYTVVLLPQFDTWCAEKADAVRTVGGLLTIATSLQDTPRLERQLRGRAGRQV